jgi:hypothetical protein
LSPKASILDQVVRKGLTKDTDPYTSNLNIAEGLIVHAMTMESDPLFAGNFSSGINLKKVRSGRVYLIGEPTDMGMTAVVEAKDEQGKTLGSYFEDSSSVLVQINKHKKGPFRALLFLTKIRSS